MAGYDLVSFFASIRGNETDPNRLLTGVAQLFAADGASLFLASSTGPGYRLAASFGASTCIPADATIVEGDSVGGQALVTHKPILITEAGDRTDLSSSMVVPLFTVERTVGLLNVSRTSERPIYDAADLRGASTVGAVLSFLFANALLVKAVDQHRYRLLGILELLGVATIVREVDGTVSGLNAAARELVGDPSLATEAVAKLPAGVAEALMEAEGALSDANPVARGRASSPDRTYGLFVMRLSDGAVAWALEDVTDAENLQAELARAHRLAEIGQMTAAIAHDIRNPLTTIIGAGRMIQKDPSMAGEFGRMVEDEANRLNELCNEFLAFAKPMKLHREEFDLAKLGGRVIEAHSAEAERQGVRLTLDSPARMPTIQADRARTEQILHNLVLNAIQACETGGAVKLIVTADGFRVEDTGKGIDENAMKRLFTPFFTTRARGTGLGLCNVKRILDAHGGRIEVHRLDPGTCFEVSLGGKAA
ncbi:MAG TPA: ATP-binding protein [Fimbriimonadaceae bacterium]|nr:ATP-binding protein [Fimbriimonadaceae bacterium]